MQVQISQTSSNPTELHNNLGNLEAQRDRVLSEWKVAKRAESKERVREALDKLIRYIVETVHPTGEQNTKIQPPNPTNSKLTTAQLRSQTWESRADDFLTEVAGHV